MCSTTIINKSKKCHISYEQKIQNIIIIFINWREINVEREGIPRIAGGY
jgi:hypothetical protein